MDLQFKCGFRTLAEAWYFPGENSALYYAPLDTQVTYFDYVKPKYLWL